MTGLLSEGVLPALLRDLYVGRKTGMLYFVRGEVSTGVRLRQGNLVRAYSNLTEDRLGETLMRLGQLSQADLDRATEIVLQDKKRLGQTLIDLGIMDQERLQDAIALHVREVLLRVLSWSEGQYSFEDQDASAEVDEDLTLKVSTGELILETVRQLQDPDVVRYALGDMDRILGLSTDPLLRFQRVTLRPEDGFLLSRIDGTMSAREIIQTIPMLPDEAQRSLLGLLCTGMAEYLPVPPKTAPKPAPERVAQQAPAAPPTPAQAVSAPPTAAPREPATAPARPISAPPPPQPRVMAPAPAPRPAAGPAAGPAAEVAIAARRQEILDAFDAIRTATHFEVLGIPRASSEVQVKEAYFRLAKMYHPDVHHEKSLADLKDKLEAVFIRLGEAYEVLRNPRTRATYEADLTARTPRTYSEPAVMAGPSEPGAAVDPETEVRLAEEAIRKAEKRYAEEKFWDAIQLLEPMIPKATGRMKQRGRVALARCYLRNPNWIKRAEETLQTVVREDPRYAEPYAVLGSLYKTSGLRSRALAMYRKALELKPDHEEAAAEVAALGGVEDHAPEPSPGGGGLLKKLFGRG